MSATATILRSSSDLSLNAKGAFRTPIIIESFLDSGGLEEIGAMVIHKGGTFRYRSVKKGFFKKTYYNVEFTGTKRLLLEVAHLLDNGNFDA